MLRISPCSFRMRENTVKHNKLVFSRNTISCDKAWKTSEFDKYARSVGLKLILNLISNLYCYLYFFICYCMILVHRVKKVRILSFSGPNEGRYRPEKLQVQFLRSENSAYSVLPETDYFPRILSKFAMKRLFAKIDSSNICQISLFGNINPRKTCKHIPDVFFWELILCESIFKWF